MVVSLDVCEVTWSELLCIMMRVLLHRPRAAGAKRNETLLASVYACQQQSFNSNGAAFKQLYTRLCSSCGPRNALRGSRMLRQNSHLSHIWPEDRGR